MFAFVVVDTDGTEGVVAVKIKNEWLPLMGADMARVDSLKPLVLADPALRGRRVTILRFGDRETIGTIDRSNEQP